LAKLDIGVHVDGYVVDTALTVNVGDHPENRPLVDAARAALEAAIAEAGPGVEVARLAQRIESAIGQRGLRPMRNLSTPDAGARLQAGRAVAIEPFATDGLGFVSERGTPEVFRVVPQQIPE